MEKFKVPVSMLAPIIDPGHLGFEDTSELEPLTEIIGQERAVEALEFGLGMKSVFHLCESFFYVAFDGQEEHCEVATKIPRHSRVNSSKTLNVLNGRPSARRSNQRKEMS